MTHDKQRSRCAYCQCGWPAALAATLLTIWSSSVVASPWDDPRWRDSSRIMQLYICGDPGTRAEWCSELPHYRLAYHIVEYDEDFGPPMSPELERWYALIARGDLRASSPADVRLIRKRAEAKADPLAMETLGYLYFNGIMVGRDLAEAYIWYARAALSGQEGAAANRDLVWALLVRENPVAARRLVERFNRQEASKAPSVPRTDGG